MPSPIYDALAGNLCRCTGYAPIVRAAEADTLARLLALRDDEAVAVPGARGRFLDSATLDALTDIATEHP